MLEATPHIDDEEFRRFTAELVARATRGTAKIRAVPRDDAEDSVQDAWERELRKNKRGKPFPEDAELMAHMSATVGDTAVEHHRRLRRKKEVPPEKRVSLAVVSEEAAAVVGGDLEEEVLSRLAAGDIAKALAELADPQVQGLAVLSALDHSDAEAGSKLGLSANEVDAARHRLKRKRVPIAKKINKTLSNGREDD